MSPSSATAGPYVALGNDTPRADSHHLRDLEASAKDNNNNSVNNDAVVANALEPHSNAIAIRLGGILAVGFLLVGYTDGLNSVISLSSFQSDRCTHTVVSPVRVATECAIIDTHWFRLAYIIGSALGPLLGGFALADRFDRKWTILTGALVFITGSAWAIGAPSTDVVQPVIARGVQGVGTSILAFAIPLVMVEIVSKRSRGFIAGVLFFGLYLGMFAWSILKLSDSAEELRDSWQVLYAIPMILAAVVGIVAVVFVPSSPRWLLYSKGVSALFDGNNALAPAVPVGSIHASDSPRRSLLEAYTLKRVGIALILLTAQQFFALVNLAQISDALEDLNEQIADTEIEHMTVSKMLQTGFNSNNGFVAFIVAIPAMISFCLIDKWGRRSLLLSGAVIIGASQLVVKHYMNTCKGELFARSCETNGVATLAMFPVAFFGLSWGPICIIYPFELFPTETRLRGTALAFAASTVVVMLIKEFYIELCFDTAVLTVVPLLTLVVVTFWCPETKGLTLEDAEKLVTTRRLWSLN